MPLDHSAETGMACGHDLAQIFGINLCGRRSEDVANEYGNLSSLRALNDNRGLANIPFILASQLLYRSGK
jgi:hypothetical protein